MESTGSGTKRLRHASCSFAAWKDKFVRARRLEMRSKVLDPKLNLTIGTMKVMALIMTLVLTCGCSNPETTSVATEQLMAKPAPPQAAGIVGGGPTRTERDLLGEKQVPADAYYGVQTARALENFQISGIPINRYPEFIEAWAIVKLA